MFLIPIKTPRLSKGDNFAGILSAQQKLQPEDIVVISSKAIATVEGAEIDLSSLTPTTEAKDWGTKIGRSPEFCECVLRELKIWNGTIVSHSPGALLTELRPEGFAKGTLLIANAGLDESNIAKGHAIGWPRDPARSTTKLRSDLSKTGIPLAVIVTDSCVHPRRLGVSAFALTVSGLDPLASQVGRLDLFEKSLNITTEAVADQLATAANFLMGNAGQSIPAVIIRDHGLAFSNYEGWVDGIEPEEDLFRSLL